MLSTGLKEYTKRLIHEGWRIYNRTFWYFTKPTPYEDVVKECTQKGLKLQKIEDTYFQVSLNNGMSKRRVFKLIMDLTTWSFWWLQISGFGFLANIPVDPVTFSNLSFSKSLEAPGAALQGLSSEEVSVIK